MTKQTSILPILFVTLLLDMIGIGMLIPIIPTLFTDPTSASFILEGYGTQAQYLIASVITALFGIMQFLAAPILVELSDVYGRKRLLTFGVAMLAIAQIVFASGIALASLTLLFISRIFAGIAGGNFSIAQAAIADITQPHDRAKNFGLIGAALGLGFIIGPFLGGVVVGATGNPALPFLLAGVLGIVNVLFITFLLPETLHVRATQSRFTILKGIHNIRHAFSDVHVRPLYGIGFFMMLGFGCFTSFISLYLVGVFHLSEVAAGTYFAVVGVWMIFTQGVLVRIVSRVYAETAILRVTLIVLACILMLYPFLGSMALLYTIMPIFSAAVGLSNVSIPALVSKNMQRDAQGTGLGIYASVQALAGAIAPLIAGALAGIIGLSSPFIFGAVSVFVAWYILYRYTQ